MDNTESLFDDYGDNNMLEDFMSLPTDVPETNLLNQNDAKSDPFGSGMDILQQSLLSADILGETDPDDFSFDNMGFTINSTNYQDSNSSIPNTENSTYTSAQSNEDPFYNVLNSQDTLNTPQQGYEQQVQPQTQNLVQNNTQPQQNTVGNNNISNQNNHFTIKMSNARQGSPYLNSSASVQSAPLISVPFSNLNQPQQNSFVASSSYVNTSNFQSNQIMSTNSQQQTASTPIVIQLNRNQQKNFTQNNVIQVQNFPSQYQSNVQVVNQQPVQIVSQPIQIANQQSIEIANQQQAQNISQPIKIVNQPIQIANSSSVRIVKQPVRIINQPIQIQSQPISNQTVQIVSRPVHILNQQSIQSSVSQQQVYNSNQYIRATSSPVVNQPVHQNVVHQNQTGHNNLNIQANNQTGIVNNLTVQQTNVNQMSLASPQSSTPADVLLEQQTNKLANLLQSKASQSGVSGIIRIGNHNFDVSTLQSARTLAASILQQQKQSKLQQQNKTQLAQPQNTNVTRQVISTSQSQEMISLSGLLARSVNNSQSTDVNKPRYVVTSVAPATTGRLTPQNLLGASPGPRASPVSHLTKSNSPTPGINRIQIASVNIPISTPSTTVSNPAHVFLKAQNVQSSFVNRTGTTTTTISQTLPTATVKVNLASQQTRNMTKEQIQKLIQNQAASQVRSSPNIVNIQQQQANNTGSQETLVKVENGKVANTVATNVLTFRVDPNLTLQQVEQIQHIIANKVPLHKISPLTREQKQLLSAFRAQLRSMDQPIQQYYLRNPQLFLQKVYQHLQTGKPFIMHMQAKVEAQANNTNSNPNPVKSIHPTISLSSVDNSSKSKMSSIKITRVIPSKPDSPLQQFRGVKRLSGTPPIGSVLNSQPQKRPTLVIEQLQRHQDLVVTPDYKTPFLNVRDACRRLLPYHALNAPEIKQENFKNSEPMFDKISRKLTEQKDKMLARYQVLCLKDSSRNTCSSDAVMLQRAFLQHEKAALAEDKQKIKDDPLSIKEFLPPDESNQELVEFLEREKAGTLHTPSPVPLQTHTRNYSSESYTYKTPSYFMDGNRSNTNSFDMSSTHTNEYEPIECEVVTTGSDQDYQLQEAVDSIM